MSGESETRPASRQSTLYYTPDASPASSRKNTVNVMLPELNRTRTSTRDNVSKGTGASPPKKSATRRFSVMSGLRRRSGSVLTEASNWDGKDRVKLVKEGYQSLAVICTFIAGVQAQIITISYNQTDLASQFVNALFFAGLFADIGAATLSAASGRWYEMMMPDEAEHVYDWVYGSENSTLSITEQEEEKEKRGVEFIQKTNFAEKGTTTLEGEGNNRAPSSAPTSAPPPCWHVKERWLCLSLKAGPYIAVLGLAFLAAGVMVWVWAHQTFIVQVLCSILCAALVILLPPFVLPHDRITALTFVKLRRFSG